MSSGMVRWGGFAVLIGIAISVVFPFVAFGLAGQQVLQAGAASVSGGLKIATAIVNAVVVAIVVFAFYTTKGYFNALSYHRADISIYIILGVQIVWGVIGLIVNISGALTSLVQSGNMRIVGIIGIVILVTMLIFVISLMIFAIFSISFGRIGGSMWKAIGILYLIGLIGIFVSVIVFGVNARGMAGVPSLNAVFAAGALLLLALLCYAAAIVCHGIGLLSGAEQMERRPSPADVF